MPIFNVGRTLEVSVTSLLKQTFEDWELLLCDDCSTDGTARIAANFADPRIKFWSNTTRAGLATRLNDCIDQARGAVFARMDGDDLSYPERFEQQLRFLNAHADVDVVSCAGLVFRNGGEAFGKVWCDGGNHATITQHPLRGFPMTHVGWMGKTAWFRKYRYDPRAIYAQDQELLYRAYGESCYASMPEILVAIREESLDLKKMVRRRRCWMRYMGWHHSGIAGLPARTYVGVVLGFKVLLDAAAILSGLDYKLLKHRARALTADEMQHWLEVHSAIEETAECLRSLVAPHESRVATSTL